MLIKLYLIYNKHMPFPLSSRLTDLQYQHPPKIFIIHNLDKLSWQTLWNMRKTSQLFGLWTYRKRQFNQHK